MFVLRSGIGRARDDSDGGATKVMELNVTSLAAVDGLVPFARGSCITGAVFGAPND